jgi:shikimate dehydrogenase
VKITGTTRLYAIIGDPIAQVRSPQVYTERFAATGIDAVLVPAHVPADRFDKIVPALLELANLDGLLVTVPFKARMVPFAQRLGMSAQAVGAVNALRREADGSWSADMFDGIGFVRGAERKGERIRGRRVALFGAGGAGSAIACALAEVRVESIDVIDVHAGKAELLVERLKHLFPHCRFNVARNVRKAHDLVINASPVGMRAGDGLPGAIESLDAATLVGDVVITETPTSLIELAMQSGCHWVDGRDMHAGQVESLAAFFASASQTSNAKPGEAPQSAQT